MAKDLYLQKGPNISGPFSLDDLRQMLLRGDVHRDSPCRQGEAGRWLTVYDFVPSARWGRSLAQLQVGSAAVAPAAATTGNGRTLLLVAAVVCSVAALGLVLFLLTNLVPTPMSFSSPGAAARPPSIPGDGLMALAFGLFALPFVVMAFGFAVSLIVFVFWLWMLVTLLTREPPGPDKIVWTIVVIILPPIGSLLYFFLRYPAVKRTTPGPA